MKRFAFATALSRSTAAILVTAALVTLPAPFLDASATELFFSEYMEGSSNNKALEIYNGTGGAIDLAAGSYSVQMFFNGSTTAGLTINLTGVVAAGDVFVLAHSGANNSILAQADQTNGSGWFNGDDAVVLRKGTTVVDVIGQIGVDPGTEWGMGLTTSADTTLRRKPAVCSNDSNGSDVFEPSQEWDGFDVDVTDGLGTHAATCDDLGGGFDSAPSISSTVPANGATTFPTNANLTVAFSEPVSVSGSSFMLACSSSGMKSVAVTGGPLTFTIDPTSDFIAGESCTLTIAAANVSDRDVNDPPDSMAADFVLAFATVDPCAAPFTRISSIQGNGAVAAITGPVDTQGVVVGDFEAPSGSNQIRGFFIQDPSGDGDATTSDGIFVFNGNNNSVSLGDIVRVNGNAAEFQGQTQVSAASVTRCGSGTVTPVDVTLPFESATAPERFEGMLVRLPQTLFVTEHFQLGRFGQVVVSSGGRLQQPTDVAEPGAAAIAVQASNDLNQLIIDDGTNVQDPDPIVFGRNGVPLSASNTLRGGDTATGTVGVMTFSWAGDGASGNAYRVRPIGALNGFVNFAPVNPRPPQVLGESGSVRVASMNLLNFFNTFNTPVTPGEDCSGGVGGAAMECRGADSAAEFDRQWPKTVAAIVGTGADIVGVIELENDGYGPTSALQFLVDRLNEVTSPGTYAFIDVDNAVGEVNALGTDAIKVGLLYKPSRALPAGQTAALNTSSFVTGGDSGPRNRPSLVQAFEESGTGARFIVSVNHLKSKGSGCDAPDVGDGQGDCNIVRTNAANELITWLGTDPTGTGDPDVLIVGDLNAYGREDPVSAIVAAGFTNLVPEFNGDRSYSYVFNGQWGSLDHALASDTLVDQVIAARDWPINADEPSVLDYNTNFKNAGQIASLYGLDPFRMSDHNPIVVDLALTIRNDNSGSLKAGGFIVLAGSSGLVPGDYGSRLQIAVNARVRKNGKPSKGHATVTIRQTLPDGVHEYEVRAKLVTTLIADPTTGLATLIARAHIADVTNGSPIGPKATLRITVDDNGRHGAGSDTVGVTVWDRNGALWFSSDWDGAKTIERPLAGGNVSVK